jgi:hypothetical protein
MIKAFTVSILSLLYKKGDCPRKHGTNGNPMLYYVCDTRKLKRIVVIFNEQNEKTIFH